MSYQITEKHGHYEVYINGKFFCSVDTITEAVNELKNSYLYEVFYEKY